MTQERIKERLKAVNEYVDALDRLATLADAHKYAFMAGNMEGLLLIMATRSFMDVLEDKTEEIKERIRAIVDERGLAICVDCGMAFRHPGGITKRCQDCEDRLDDRPAMSWEPGPDGT
jgi:hypothetical protein